VPERSPCAIFVIMSAFIQSLHCAAPLEGDRHQPGQHRSAKACFAEKFQTHGCFALKQGC
jgi:hypothetical protein